MQHTEKKLKIKKSLGASIALALAGVFTVPAVSAEQVEFIGGKEVTPQIVGGTVTTPNSRPYQVALLMNGRQGCGGTLIAPQWVLTAAHCLDSASTSSLTVRVGAHRMSANDGTTIRVSQIINHEYWRGSQGITSGYDIAVLRLASPAPSSIRPAKLPSQALANQIAAVGQSLTVSGWGLTQPGSRTPSDVLREVNLPVMSNSACSSQLGANVGNGVICGDGPSGRSACNGDSGGPYAASYNGNFYSIGTVSWGRGCVGATAFTRTTAYLDWIEQKTGVKPDGDTTDAAPTARFTATPSGLTVNFQDSSSDDRGIASHQWSFGDGSSSSQASPSHTYAQDGTYTVTLRVTDSAGQTDSTAQSITVTEGDPCLATAATYPAWNANTNYGIGDRVSYNGKNYEATWWSTGATPSIYTNVWRELGDNGNGCDENQAPVASFSATTNGLSASFSNTSTDDKGVVSHSWNFGDGSGSSAVSPSHTYGSAGTYTVTLQVTDAEGLSSTTSRTVTVDDGNTGGCNGIDAWSASTSYVNGDVVSFQGNIYRATWWSTGARPDLFSNVWSFQGACN